eukprot:1400284-Karenia_brevis.AAC.1
MTDRDVINLTDVDHFLEVHVPQTCWQNMKWLRVHIFGCDGFHVRLTDLHPKDKLVGHWGCVKRFNGSTALWQ